MTEQIKDFQNHAYLLLGTNQGDRSSYLSKAIQQLKKYVGTIVQNSFIYQTKAWGMTNQPDFLNQVIAINTQLTPFELLDTCQKIEKKLGRKRIIQWGQRTIDIDILYFNKEIISSKNLTIPHPEIPNRRFTLVPMVEIAADWVHPILNKSQKDLLSNCKDKLEVIRIE